MHIATIPSGAPFLDTLAAVWLAAPDDPGDGLILLPTRRAARALGEAFLRVTQGRPLLLPRIAAIGGLDDESLALGSGFGADVLALPPAVEPVRRLAVLSRLIDARERAAGRALPPDLAWQMAGELARLLDDAQRAEIDLGHALRGALGEGFAADFAEHWRVTLEFLDIVTRFWPDWLAEQGLIDPVERQMRALRLRAQAWSERPPPGRLVAAGISVTNPASAALLASVARAPQGVVVLPGLDLDLTERDWSALGETHPQADLRRLLEALGARREEVVAWPASTVVPQGRTALLRQVLLPETGLGDWLADRAPAELAGVSRIEAADAEEEAQAIALALRDALEIPGRRAALVTPDRALAARVVTALGRWSVHVEDSVGEPLSATPPAVLIRLLLEAVNESFAPVPLLALLKHPLVTLGLGAASCRALARRLELACLRGPRPAPGLAGLRAALAASRQGDDPALVGLIDRLEQAVAPLLGCAEGELATLLTAVIEAAEALSVSDGGGLWSGEEGAALSAALAALIGESEWLPPMRRDSLGRFLDTALVPQTVRTRRALRGRGVAAEHPRLFVWGLLEARLQSVDMVILAGLGEGVWPAATDPGPWLSRPMRSSFGLDSPERAVGAAAADFAALACAAPEIVLSVSRRREGAPLVPSRWLVRLDAFLAGRGQAVPAHPALGWARALDRPEGGVAEPVRPPQPCPPVALRPRTLSVTEIDTLKADPYAIHAKHILRLRRLDPPQQSADASDFGQIVHEGLADILGDGPRLAGLVAGAAPEAALAEALDAALAARLAGNPRVSAALGAWWRPRLRRIAGWVAGAERDWRAELGVTDTRTECRGEVRFTPADGHAPFTLTGRADRLDVTRTGGVALLDYKTGTVPQDKDVAAGWMSQLPLEAAMALRGAFAGVAATTVEAMAYWKLSGGEPAGESKPLKGDPGALAEAAWEGLLRLIAEYDDPARAYLSHPRPGREPRYADYRQLARHGEWAATIGEAS